MIPRDDVRAFYARVQAERRREALMCRCVWAAVAVMALAILIGWLR